MRPPCTFINQTSVISPTFSCMAAAANVSSVSSKRRASPSAKAVSRLTAMGSIAVSAYSVRARTLFSLLGVLGNQASQDQDASSSPARVMCLACAACGAVSQARQRKPMGRSAEVDLDAGVAGGKFTGVYTKLSGKGSATLMTVWQQGEKTKNERRMYFTSIRICSAKLGKGFNLTKASHPALLSAVGNEACPAYIKLACMPVNPVTMLFTHSKRKTQCRSQSPLPAAQCSPGCPISRPALAPRFGNGW